MTLTPVVDPVFRSIPRNSTCFLKWRVEKMHLVPVVKEQYGKFYKGDSYIILSGSEFGTISGTDNKPKEVRGNVEYHVHFWLGSATTADEAGVAAYKTVELDDYLGGNPIQHREVEGCESKRFISYFKGGIRLLIGGVDSGFNHVKDAFKPRLFLVKGKKTPLVSQLSKISWSEMNEGDAFVLETKDIIFVWNGRVANNKEKIQAAFFSNSLKDERGSGQIVIVEDGEEGKLAPSEKEVFEQFLSLSTKAPKSVTSVGNDLSHERRETSELKLYCCCDDGGTLKVTEVKNGPLLQTDLSSDDSFVIDNGPVGIWVWVGKRASRKERAEAMRNAQGFIKKKGYPEGTPVTRVIDGGEPTDFQYLFLNWKNKNAVTPGLGRQMSMSKIAKTVQTKFDATTLHENPSLAAESQLVDDGSGKKEVWRVENFELVPVPREAYGTFFGGDCYVIKYSCNYSGTPRVFIYFWLGQHSSADEQGTAALKTVEMDNQMGGHAIQVRVVQGKEPQHFMAMFQGKMMVFSGGKAGKFDGDDVKDNDIPEKYLLHIRGTTQYNTKAVQVDCRASSLNSNDVFLLREKKNNFIWAGKGSTGDEREMAKKLAGTWGNEPEMVYEGQEKQDFWKAIGGQEPYSSEKKLWMADDSQPARLFHCSNASGRFVAEEVVDFCQIDLVPEDVMLLDAWNNIFIWIGNESRKEEQELTEQLAYDYLKTDPAGRDLRTPVIKLKQGYEAPIFTGFFGVWDNSLWAKTQSYQDVKSEFISNNANNNLVSPVSNGARTYHKSSSKYPLEVLKEKDVDKLPDGVDPSQKEYYLLEDEFLKVFSQTLEEFEKLPNWKKQQLKKSAGIF